MKSDIKALFGFWIFLFGLAVLDSVQAIEIDGPSDPDKVLIREVCVNGNVYVVMVTGEGYNFSKGIAITQVMKKSVSDERPLQPKTCEGKVGN